MASQISSLSAMASASDMGSGGAASRPKNAAIFGHMRSQRKMSLLVMLSAWFAQAGSVAAHTVALAGRVASVISIRLV